MRRVLKVSLLAWICFAPCLAGCGRPAQVEKGASADATTQQAGEGRPAAPAEDASSAPPLASGQPTPREQYDEQLLAAVGFMGEGNYAEALAALERARRLEDNESIRLEIARVKLALDRQEAMRQTVADVELVLREGKPDEAAALAARALAEFGGAPGADQVARLKRQADALLAASMSDADARFRRFRQEGEQALRDQNVRAAVLAHEQAVLAKDDAALQKELKGLRERLANYDDNLRRASELRAEPDRLEEALAALESARSAWDNFQVRQEIDACQLAIQKRRDRLGVAEFEVRGDVGMPEAGRTIAESLLPHFKPRFDLVERTQVDQLLAELKVQADDLGPNDEARQELARLTRTRYLVLGSATPLAGITVQARIIDLHTGLIVQTGRINAATPEQLLARLPKLAKMLLMSDDERVAYERQLQKESAPPPRVVANAPLPPPPTAVDLAAAPPVTFIDVPPPSGGLTLQDYQRLPTPGGPDAPPVLLVSPNEETVKRGLLAVSLEVGDGLFRAGKFAEAFARFQFALTLAPREQAVLVRLDNCRPHLPPPPPPVVVVPRPPRPRLAILDFQLFVNPAATPPGFGAWAAEQLGPYFCHTHELVDRGEVYWYAGRLGLSLRDVLFDHAARRWLARAMGVRFFVLGTIHETASYDVRTYFLDAETGQVLGRGFVHAYDRRDLKLRMAELARLTVLPLREIVAYEQQSVEYDRLVREGQIVLQKGNFALAIGFFTQARALRPQSVQLGVLLNEAEMRRRQAELEALRRQAWERQQAEAEALARRQRELVLQAEAARQAALRQASALAEAERRRLEQERDRAFENLLVQGRVAFQRNDFAIAVDFFTSAANLRPTDAAVREVAVSRARLEEERSRQAQRDQARRDAERSRQREAELAQAQAKLEKERLQREAEARAREREREQRDAALYDRLRDEGQRQLAAAKFDDAIAAFQNARQLRQTKEIDDLLNQALRAQSLASANDREAQAKLEKQLAEERERRERAEAEARKNRDLYDQAMQLAQAALGRKEFDQAIAQYQAAGKLFRTDAVLSGIQKAEEAKAQAAAGDRKKVEESRRQAQVQKLLADGQAALAAKRLDEASKAFAAAKRLDPMNTEVLAGLTRVDVLQNEQLAEARREKEARDRATAIQKLIDQGKARARGQQYDAAIQAFNEALQLDPSNQAAKTALTEAQAARDASLTRDKLKPLLADARKVLAGKKYDEAAKILAQAGALAPGDKDVAQLQKELSDAQGRDAASRKQEADFQAALRAGRKALQEKRYDDALKELGEAAKIKPNDPDLAGLTRAAQRGKQEADAAAKTKAEDERKFKQLLADARKALAGKKYDEAAKILAQAGALAPGDKDVAQLQKELSDAQGRDAASRKQEADFQAALRAGRKALQEKRYDDALKELGEAAKIKPNDPDLAGLTRAAQRGKQEADAAAKKKVEFDQWMAKGKTAVASKRFDEAVAAFEEALKVLPGEQAAERALKEARQAQADARKPPEKPSDNPAEGFQELMKTAAAAEKRQDYAAAEQAYRNARKLRPNDDKAKTGVQFTANMARGQDYLKQKSFKNAAKEFEDALKIIPNHHDATRLLKQARDGK